MKQPRQPVLVLLTSHWITMLGVALATLAGFTWVFCCFLRINSQDM